MNRTFNVLDPQLDICGNFLLEASAGTGKTFTIAHLVARFVLEPTHDMPLKKMAIITFTKASASELKKRIKELFLELKEKTQNNLPTFFDSFEIDRNHLLLKIDLAIETLDEAFIQTIHGFSFRLLKKFAPQLNLFIPQEQEEAQDLEKLSYDFIYEELTSDSIGQVLKPFQLQTLLGSHRGSLHQLILALRQKILNDIDIKTPKTFEESKQEILQSIRSFSKQFSFENLVDVAYKFKYTGITKEEVAEQILSFLNVVFENQPLESVIFKPCFLNFLEEENLKKNQIINLECENTQFLFQLKDLFLPFLSSVFHLGKIELLVCQFLKNKFQKLLVEKNILSFSSILKTLEVHAKDKKKALILRNSFEIVIIDEFQDTDETQWNIVDHLFIKEPVKALYMVGDPKQAIYAFRAADVYTYIRAKEKTPNLKLGTLNTCYRSTENLISALNFFFSTTQWIELPYTKNVLSFEPVKSAKSNGLEEKPFVFYGPFQELDDCEKKVSDLAFNLALQYPFDKIAILVKDRFQMDRMEDCLKKKNLNFSSFKNEFLENSKIHELLLSFIEILNSPLDDAKCLKFLISIFCHSPLDQILEKKKDVFLILNQLKQSFAIDGIFIAFEMLLNFTPSFFDNSIKQNLIAFYGFEFLEKVYYILQQIDDKVDAKKEVLLYKLGLELLIKENTLLPQTRNLVSQIELLTTHMSKGLEFDHVIALGTSTQASFSQKVLIKKSSSGLFLDVCDDSIESTLAIHELDAEKLRQMYVAFTRAKKTLHVPFIEDWNQKRTLGSLSCLEYFFLKSSFDDLDYKSLYSQTFSYQDRLKKVLSHPHIELKATIDQKSGFSFKRPYFDLDLTTDYASFDQNFITSFSSLKTGSSHFSLTKEETILKGKDYGDFFHKLVEEIIRRNVYSIIDTKECQDFIFSWIEGSQYENEKELVYSHLKNAMNVPLTTDTGVICLKDVLFENILIEKDFIFYQESSLIKGFIDCIFIHENKIYFIDWKTSYLESKDAPYVQTYMEESAYTLQLEIYKEAISKRLNYFPNMSFGKAFYIFVKSGIVYEETGAISCLA